MGLGRHAFSPAELKAILAAERRGSPFLIYRDGEGRLELASLENRERLSIGRVAGHDLVLAWDPKVSRSHAQLERIGLDWTLSDDGLSRNGCYVNELRIPGRRRLADGDVIRLGRTSLLFRSPLARGESTLDENAAPVARVTAAERRVLVALCAPFVTHAGGPSPVPATNREIAAALHVSVDSVKTHVRSLFAKLEIGDLPQYQKRTELARRALESGLVIRRDYDLPG